MVGHGRGDEPPGALVGAGDGSWRPEDVSVEGPAVEDVDTWPLIRGGSLGGTCWGTRDKAASCPLKSNDEKEPESSALKGEEKEVAGVEDELGSGSNEERGLGEVMGVDASDRGGERDPGPNIGAWVAC